MSTRRKTYTREDLNEKQEKWLDGYLARGGTRIAATEAYMAAYDIDDKAQASRAASRLLKHEKIQDILVEEAKASFPDLAVQAVESLQEMQQTGMSFGQPIKPADMIKINNLLLERALGPLTQVHQHEHSHHTEELSGSDLMKAVIGEIRKMPVSDRQAIVRALQHEMPNVIEADFEEVDPEAPYGRKKDGAPQKKRGRPPVEKRILPGPEAYKPPVTTAYEDRVAAIKAKKLREARNADKS